MDATMTPRQAADAIATATRWEASLAQRVEGLTWMVWGVVMAGMFVSYGLAGVAGAPPWTDGVLWAPWIAAGNLVTWALWRTAALATPAAARKGDLRHYLGLLVVFAVVFAVMGLVLRPTSWSIPMGLTGLVWAFMGLLVPRMSRQGVAVSAAIGLAVAVAAVVLSALRLPEDVGGSLATATVGLVPMAGGLWQVLRG